MNATAKKRNAASPVGIELALAHGARRALGDKLMITHVEYRLTGDVEIRGTVQVEFAYRREGHGAFVEDVEAVAESATIVDHKSRHVGSVELLTDEQRARFGAVVLRECREDIEDACLEAGRELSPAHAY